jgi:hypothetical protein
VKAASERANVRVLALRASPPRGAVEPASAHPYLFRTRASTRSSHHAEPPLAQRQAGWSRLQLIHLTIAVRQLAASTHSGLEHWVGRLFLYIREARVSVTPFRVRIRLDCGGRRCSARRLGKCVRLSTETVIPTCWLCDALRAGTREQHWTVFAKIVGPGSTAR